MNYDYLPSRHCLCPMRQSNKSWSGNFATHPLDICISNVFKSSQSVLRKYVGDPTHLQLEEACVPHQYHGGPVVPGRVAAQLQRHPAAGQLSVCHMSHLCVPATVLHETHGQEIQKRR